MNFNDKIKIEGHLKIVKLFTSGESEVVHDDSNVITGGMGRSIAQFMTMVGCDEETCGVVEDVPSGCGMGNYHITRFQVGQGASAQPETSAVQNLGLPLTDTEYGGALRSVTIEPNAWLWSDFEVPVAKQDFGVVLQQGTLTSSLVSVWSFDEETANGTTLNEAGLFVENPYLYTTDEQIGAGHDNPFVMVGGTFIGSPEDEMAEQPGKGAHLLAAYKHYEPIRKEKYFSLLYRWTINFSVERV